LSYPAQIVVIMLGYGTTQRFGVDIHPWMVWLASSLGESELQNPYQSLDAVELLLEIEHSDAVEGVELAVRAHVEALADGVRVGKIWLQLLDDHVQLRHEPEDGRFLL
jgi:hypothetical protein